jgi:hypothetical protein
VQAISPDSCIRGGLSSLITENNRYGVPNDISRSAPGLPVTSTVEVIDLAAGVSIKGERQAATGGDAPCRLTTLWRASFNPSDF